MLAEMAYCTYIIWKKFNAQLHIKQDMTESIRPLTEQLVKHKAGRGKTFNTNKPNISEINLILKPPELPQITQKG